MFISRMFVTQGIPSIFTESFCYLWQEVDVRDVSCNFEWLTARVTRVFEVLHSTQRDLPSYAATSFKTEAMF
jgi:hypothetical protein